MYLILSVDSLSLSLSLSLLSLGVLDRQYVLDPVSACVCVHGCLEGVIGFDPLSHFLCLPPSPLPLPSQSLPPTLFLHVALVASEDALHEGGREGARDRHERQTEHDRKF